MSLKKEKQNFFFVYFNYFVIIVNFAFAFDLKSYPGINFVFLFVQVYVTKRPHVDEFLRRVGELFECVLFTASLAKVNQ